MKPGPSKQAGPVSPASLPATAQRWLANALPSGPTLPTRMRIEQEGSMDIRGRWTPFQATGIYQASPLSFNWRARFRVLPGVWIVADDGHLGDHGWGSARLWGVIPMGTRTDPQVLASQVVRNLAELAWLPAFVLADQTLSWTDAGDTAFEVHRQAADQEVRVRFELDERGDILRAASPARFYDVPGGYASAPWHYEFSDHREMGGGRIPAAAVARFEKEAGPWEYFRGRVTACRDITQRE